MAIPQPRIPIASEIQEIQDDRAVIRRFLNPTNDGGSLNSNGVEDARTRLRRACSEVHALERMTWRAKVTLLLAEADMEVELQGKVFRRGVTPCLIVWTVWCRSSNVLLVVRCDAMRCDAMRCVGL